MSMTVLGVLAILVFGVSWLISQDGWCLVPRRVIDAIFNLPSLPTQAAPPNPAMGEMRPSA